MLNLSEFSAEDWLLIVVFIMVLILVIRIKELKKDVTIYVTLVNTLLWICIGLITLKTRAVERDNMNKMYKYMGKLFGRDNSSHDSLTNSLNDDPAVRMRENYRNREVGSDSRGDFDSLGGMSAFNKNVEYFNSYVKQNPQGIRKEAMHRVNKINNDLHTQRRPIDLPQRQRSHFAAANTSQDPRNDSYEDYAYTYTDPNTCTPNVKPYRAFRQYNQEDNSLRDSCNARSQNCRMNANYAFNPIAQTSTSVLEDPNREFYNGYDAPMSNPTPTRNSQTQYCGPYEQTRMRDMNLRYSRPDLFPNNYGNSCARDGMNVGTSNMFDTGGNSASDRAVRYNRAQNDWHTKSTFNAKKSNNPNNMKKYWQKELDDTYAREWWQQE